MQRRTLPISEGVRARFNEFLNIGEISYLRLKALGISKHRAKTIRSFGIVPSLREALAIDCATNGQCSVYDWCETEYMVSVSAHAVDEQNKTLFHKPLAWPLAYSNEAIKELRKRLIQRLSRPDNNALSITRHVGKNALNKQRRHEILKRTELFPVSVEDDASEQELQRAIEKRERLRYRRRAFRKGTRSSIDE